MNKTASTRMQRFTFGNTSLHSEDFALRFRELHRLSLTNHPGITDLYQDYVETGCRLLDMRLGIVSHIADDKYIVQAVTSNDRGIRVGQDFDLTNTYYSRISNQTETLNCEQTGNHKDVHQHPLYQQTRMESFITAPILVNEEIFASLSFFDAEPRSTPFDTCDCELIELMALGIGKALEIHLARQRHAELEKCYTEATNLFESTFEYSSIGKALVSPEGQLLRVNQALCDMVGYTSDELLTHNVSDITHPDDRPIDKQVLSDFRLGKIESNQREKRYMHKDGYPIWIRLITSMAHGAGGSPKYLISQMEDVTEARKTLEELKKKQKALEQANHTLSELAIHDPLTQLYNRGAFDQQLELERHKSARTSLPLSLLLLDIDYFKKYNDKFGHVAGDKALQSVANIMKKEARITDFVARIGGEEFAIIMANTDSKGSLQFAERLRKKIAKIKSIDNKVTASIGVVTVYPDQCDVENIDSNKLLIKADEALYMSKAMGRDHTTQLGLDA